MSLITPDYEDSAELTFSAKSENEGFARVCAAAFVTRLNPTVGEIEDVKTAVSEAVTNAIIHGYGDNGGGEIKLICELKGRVATFTVADDGRGIADVEKAKEPLFTTAPELERSGMGFTVMETFMDALTVTSAPGKGTTVKMTKTFAAY